MPKVLIFKETLLPPSETFILAQMSALKTYAPELIGLERTRPSLSLPGKPILLSERSQKISGIEAKLYRRLGIAPFFHGKAKLFAPDLLHAHFASGGRAALPLARALGVPLVVTLHGSDVTVRSNKQDVYKRLGEEGALFICISEFIRDRALDAGFPAEKLVLHYIGIDREQFSARTPRQASDGVLFVGRLVEKKGCEYLIRAMELVQRNVPGSELTIIGDGPLRSSLESLAGQLNVKCRFLGTQPREVIRKALEEAGVFCAPSVTAANGDSEGLPTVLAEAHAMGLPVVSTLHAGIPEIVAHGVTGLLAPERDHQALADSLSRLLIDKALWERFHRAALLRIEEHFDLQTQTAILEEIYTGLLRKGAASRRIDRRFQQESTESATSTLESIPESTLSQRGVRVHHG